MFDSIRKHQRLLQFLLLILIFPAFAFFGVSGYQSFMSDGDGVATVNGTKISRQQFDQAMREQLERMRQVLGDQIDAKLLDTPSARTEVLDGLINQQLLLDAAVSKRISVSDSQLQAAINAIPAFRKADGSFDMERYRTILSSQGMSELGFESQLRRDLAMQALPQSAALSVIVPRTILDRLILIQDQVRESRERVFLPQAFASQVKPDEAQLRKYYEDNATAFETPESAKIEYLVLGAQELADAVTLSADDVKTYYEQNLARYATPEERRASHILISLPDKADDGLKEKARQKAQELVLKARSGVDFAALAKADSQDPGSAAQGGDLGFFRRDTMVKPFADAAFSLKDGQISDPVLSEFGYHVIKLTGIKAGTTRAFDQVRAEIEKELRQQQASRKFAENAEAFSNLVYEQADSLKPAAERFGLKIQQAQVERSGAGKDKNPVLSNRKLLDALFSADSIANRRNTDAIEAGSNTLVSARIVEYTAAQRKKFESVQDEVRNRVVASESQKLATQAGKKLLAELRSGSKADGFGTVQKLSRSNTGELTALAVAEVFKASTDKLPAYVGVENGTRGYAIYLIEKVVDPNDEQIAARREGFTAQIAQLTGQQQSNDLIAALRSQAKIQTNLQSLDQGR